MRPSIILLGLCFLLATTTTQIGGSSLNVHFDQPGHQIAPLLWGIFFEEINHAGEGGLYAELIQNRAFSPKNPTLEGYSLIKSGSASGQISLASDVPLNDVIPNSLHLHVDQEVGEGERVGVANGGFWGIPIRPDYTIYHASFYAKASPGFTGPLSVSIESNDGTLLYASGTVSGITSEFQKFELLLQPLASMIEMPSSENRFIISTLGPVPANTSIYLNIISLFPPTYNNRKNGLRMDLAEKLAAMKPSFLRFPGGNFLEGNTIEERFIWEETIGDISRRPGHMGCWGYYSTDGLGLLEYLEFSEDLNAEIILGLFAGYALNGVSVPPEDMGPYIDSALNEIEYLIGDSSTVWGARRIADGHEAPFKLTYVEIGNEDWFSSDYEIRYPLFYDAIVEKYPQLQIIATQHVNSRPVPIRDDHFYPGFGWFPDNHAMYDSAPRNGSQIFVGEYACRDNAHPKPEANTAAAMDDAAFMTGIERNSDIVTLACYAPLFAHVGDLNWTPDGIYYDGLSSFNNAAMWVQHMFSVYRGDLYLPTESDANPKKFFHVASKKVESNTLILKIVNTDVDAILIDTVQLEGVTEVRSGVMTMLTGERWAVNELSDPMKISPNSQPFEVTGNSFSFNAPAFSLTVFEFQV